MSPLQVIPALLGSRIAAQRGAVLIQIAVMLVGIIGFVSLGTEIVLLLATSRRMQSAADAGALAAVSARIRGYPADYKQEALALAADAGFTHGVAGTTVTVNAPPASGNYTSATDAIEVLISEPQVLPLARMVYLGSFTIRARSVARITGYGSCVLALDPSGSASFSMNGTTVADFVGCDLSVNSSSPQAVAMVGGAVINAGYLLDVGGYALSGGATINAVVRTGAPATTDPYAGYVMPTAASTCLPDPNVKTGTKSIPPGTYCSISVSSGATLTLSAGTYIIKGGQLSIGSGGTLTGTGVTIVLTGAGSAYATVDISSNATVTLSAPTSGPTAGLVFFQDRDAPTKGVNTFSGGATQNITGALYFPHQTVRFGGGNASTVTCSEIVAWQVEMIGNAVLNVSGCAGTGVLPIGAGQPTMVE